MCAKKRGEELTLMDAVDNLSALAELDMVSAEEAREEAIESKHVVKWVSPTLASKNQEEVKETFKVLHNYLKHIYHEERSRLKEPETQKGIQAIMVLAGEAAQKVDRFTDIFQGATKKGSVTELKEFQDLQKFYLTNIIKRFQETLEAEEAWQDEWGQEEENVLDIERRGLKDLETVRRDCEYELFYLCKEDGHPFYNRNLLRHIRLVGDFDEAVSVVERGDPLLKIKIIHDREVLHTAKEILKSTAPYIDSFYKDAFRFKKKRFVVLLNKALMALMLAGNARNSIQTTSGKSCLLYFCDFHDFLREMLLSKEYQHYLRISHTDIDPFFYSLINLSHCLCMHFFMRVVPREGCINFIYSLIEKKERKEETAALHQFFHLLLDEDERLRTLLKKYPNGPVLKTLDILKKQEEERAFDPLTQQNFPHQLFSFLQDEQHITCLHIACPTLQKDIGKVEIVEEFRGFLRAIDRGITPGKHLLINLQDRTSWQEHARSVCLEELQREAEFASSLLVTALPKNTDFYLQTSFYLQLSSAKDFKRQLLAQITSGPDCGFFFPKRLNEKEIFKFSEKTIEMIHKVFFDRKETLTRKNRLDFIEIFYQFFICKIIAITRPDSISFTCKDGIDSGAAQAAGYYLFLRLISDTSKWKREEKDLVLWILYAPALFIRERAIDIQRLQRMISSLALIDAELQANRKAFLKAFDETFKSLKLT